MTGTGDSLDAGRATQPPMEPSGTPIDARRLE